MENLRSQQTQGLPYQMMSFLAKENLCSDWQERASRISERPAHDYVGVRGSQRASVLAFSAPGHCVTPHKKLAGAFFRPVLKACGAKGPTFWRTLLQLLLLELPIETISGAWSAWLSACASS